LEGLLDESDTLDEKDEGQILADKKFVDLPFDSIKETLTTSLNCDLLPA
jgi:hypothetical protein